MSYKLGVDIGGTFTDIVLLGPGGELHSKKILFTPDDYSLAMNETIKSWKIPVVFVVGDLPAGDGCVTSSLERCYQPNA